MTSKDGIHCISPTSAQRAWVSQYPENIEVKIGLQKGRFTQAAD